MSHEKIRSDVERYYSAKVAAHGPTPMGVDWNSPESQRLRFDQLVKVIEPEGAFTINDYGCGYGALVDYLEQKELHFNYCGFDISADMLAEARRAHSGAGRTFVERAEDLQSADYTVASGIFNVRLETPEADWRQYILDTLQSIDALSRKGFSFNVLTKYSDAEFMRPTLYYADPAFFFDYCKTQFSRFVALLHDYPLYEFTLLVRKP